MDGEEEFIDHSELQDTHSAASLLGTEILYFKSLGTLAGFYHHATETWGAFFPLMEAVKL